MAWINILLNSLTGEIAHMNSLSNEFFTGYKVQTILVGTHHIPLYVEFTESELSHIWLRPLKVKEGRSGFKEVFEPSKFTIPMTGAQGSLF